MKNNNLNKNKKKAFISIFAIFFSAIIISVLTATYILLIKQIEISNIDAQSFQALYTADSLFECIIYKEQNATGTASVLYPDNYNDFGNCGELGDANFTSPPFINTNRYNSILNLSITVNEVPYCAVARIQKYLPNLEFSNFITIAGQSRDCLETGSKVVERVVDLYY